MNTKEILQSIGLSEKASKIYIATLPLGTASIQDIAKAAKLKRASMYPYIEELLEAELVEKAPIGKRVYYRCASPTQIEEKLQNQLQNLQSKLPELQALHNTSAKPHIQILEGKKGVQHIYKECLTHPFIRSFCYLPDIDKLFHSEVETWGNAMLKDKIRLQELMPNRPETRRTSRQFGAHVGGLYESRMVEGDVYNDMLIYGDTVAILRIQELNLFIVRIEDKTIATSMKTLFDAAWKGATPYYPRKK